MGLLQKKRLRRTTTARAANLKMRTSQGPPLTQRYNKSENTQIRIGNEAIF